MIIMLLLLALIGGAILFGETALLSMEAIGGMMPIMVILALSAVGLLVLWAVVGAPEA